MTPIYKKQGRRYVEIGVYDNEALYYPHGAHLIWSRPGGALTHYNIEPADAALLAAAARMREPMVEAMRKTDAMELKPAANRRPLTKLERKAWDAYKAIAGAPQSLYLEGKSLHDVVQAGIDVLIEAVKKGEKQ